MHFHTFSSTYILKKYKQHYSNSSNKRALGIYFNKITDTTKFYSNSHHSQISLPSYHLTPGQP